MTSAVPRRLLPVLLPLFDFLLPFAVVCVFLALGDLAKDLLRTWIPGSVIGMLLLLLALSSGLVKASWLDRLSDWLLDRLGLFFVCPGVEVIRYLDLAGSHWLSLAVAIVGSSAVTLVATGWVSTITTSRRERREHNTESEK